MPGRTRSSRFSQSASGTHPSTDPTHAGTLLVFPFENGSRIASVDWLGEGLSELTVERLEDRGLNVLSRQDRLAALEKIGLPDSARFSHATMVKIATEADADEVVLGRFVSDGKTVTLEARVLSVNYWTRGLSGFMWSKYHLPFYLQQLLVMEAATFSPWIIAIVLCFGALLLSWQLKLARRADQ